MPLHFKSLRIVLWTSLSKRLYQQWRAGRHDSTASGWSLQKLYGGKTLLGRTSFADVSDFISSASFDGKTGCTENHVGKSEFNRVLYQSGENDGTDAEADGTTEANPDLE